MGPLRVALAQTVGTPADVGANLALLGATAERAAAAGAGLLVFPELFLTGYNIGAAVAQLAEAADGPSTRVIAGIARRLGLAIVFGYAERSGEGVYNTAALIDAEGRMKASYRKTHLWGDFERTHFRAGDACATFDFAGRRLGLVICFDLEFPETVRAMALAGAEAVIAISATTAPYAVVPRHVVPARAYENSIFVVFCNRAGEESGLAYAGESCIAAPDGSLLLACGAGEDLAMGEMASERFAEYRRAHRYLDDRRPELYRS